MLPLLRVFLFLGVVISVVTTIFVGLAASDERSSRLPQAEQDDSRHHARQRETQPTALPASADVYEFRSGLTPAERRALREQLRGANPEHLSDGGNLSESASESVAVNESYADGVAVPVPESSGQAGPNR